jgi:hypothetical protein
MTKTKLALFELQGDKDHLDAIDFYKAGFITGAVSAFVEGPIDFYKSQLQVQVCTSHLIFLGLSIYEYASESSDFQAIDGQPFHRHQNYTWLLSGHQGKNNTWLQVCI